MAGPPPRFQIRSRKASEAKPPPPPHAPAPDNPRGHIRQTAEQSRRKGQLMRLPGGEREGNGAPAPVRDHTGFCAIAAARAAKRLAHISLLAVDPLFSAPAALW